MKIINVNLVIDDSFLDSKDCIETIDILKKMADSNKLKIVKWIKELSPGPYSMLIKIEDS